MSIAEIKRTYMPAELLALPDAINYELVDGEAVLPGFRCPVNELFPDSNTHP